MDSLRAEAFWCAILFACLPGAGLAQQAAKDFPSKPIRLVIPYAAGGSMDIVGRALGQKIAPTLGQNLYLDNRGGAGGVIGTDVVAKSAPDGYTILLTSSSHTTLQSLHKNLPYDPVKDFLPITLVARSVGSLLTVHPSVPAHSVQEFVALAKAHPGKLNYGSGGIGNTMQFAAEAFSMMAGTKLTHVPYKGAGQAIIDLLAGHIDLCVITAAVVVNHVRAGKLRALGITAPVRWSELPDVPTMTEAGIKGYEGFKFVTWYGLWYPARTANEYAARIRGEVSKAFEDPATKRVFLEQGLIPVASTSQEFVKAITEATELNRSLVARMGLKPQ